MKLKTKLLPLVGIAATAAVVTPLVTSCKLSKIDMVDLSKPYTPTTKSSVAGELTQQAATQTYINDVKTNSEIFRQDFLYGVQTKVNKIKNEFNSLPTDYGYLDTTNFKVNSLKAGLTNPTFSTTTIAYPEEPSVTYPTVSFEYTIQLNYTYEYIFSNESVRWYVDEWEFGDKPGYYSKTNNIEINVKYTNVPFMANAHEDNAGSNTYWQVSPIDTISMFYEEGQIWYNQAYMYEYMSDDWSIDVNATIENKNKSVTTYGDNYESTKTLTTNKTISKWEDLEEFVESEYATAGASDIANYEEVLVNLANFGFESWYLSSVKQLPEVIAVGGMSYMLDSESYATAKTADVGYFYLPQTFTGDIQLYASYDETTKTPSEDIVLNNIKTEDGAEMTITIPAGTALTQTGSYNDSQYLINDVAFAIVKEPGEQGYATEYNFQLPKFIYVQFTPTTGDAWVQQLYLNQDSLAIYQDDGGR